MRREVTRRLAAEQEFPPLAQIARFKQVNECIGKWSKDLSSWSIEGLWGRFSTDTQSPSYVKDLEAAPYFPVLKGHLVEPAVSPTFWGWWEELKQATSSLEAELQELWENALKIAREGTALPLKPTPQNQPVEGITPYFFESLLLPNPSYEWGQVNYCKTLGGWYNAKEGLVQRNKGEIPAIITSGNPELPSIPLNQSVIIHSGSSPDAVRFYLRVKYESGRYLALVRSPDELPSVLEAHEQARKNYGPKLPRLTQGGEAAKKLIAEFIGQLEKLKGQREFPGNCAQCLQT